MQGPRATYLRRPAGPALLPLLLTLTVLVMSVPGAIGTPAPHPAAPPAGRRGPPAAAPPAGRAGGPGARRARAVVPSAPPPTGVRPRDPELQHLPLQPLLDR